MSGVTESQKSDPVISVTQGVPTIRDFRLTPGVYQWVYRDTEGKESVLYVGRSKKSTYDRAISELFRLTFSSAKPYSKLDTDFIVGTCIRMFSQKGRVYWQHHGDQPEKERRLWEENKGTFLQRRSTRIDEKWRCANASNKYNRKTPKTVMDAESEIRKMIKKSNPR